jgi:predicted DNA-binding ribbon-helix-helix protein
MRLEPQEWSALDEICAREKVSLNDISTSVASHKGIGTSVTSAIRVFVMRYFQVASTQEGHIKAGHGVGRLTQFGLTTVFGR